MASAASVFVTACSGSSSAIDVTAAPEGGAFEQPPLSEEAFATDAGLGPDGGPPPDVAPMSNGAYVFPDGAVRYWNTGTFTLAAGTATSNAGSSLYGGFERTSGPPGGVDASTRGFKDGACSVLTSASLPSFPRKDRRDAGILTLSVVGSVRASVSPRRGENDYVAEATPSWFREGLPVALAFSGADVPPIGIDVGVVPVPVPDEVRVPAAWPKTGDLVLSWPVPVSRTGFLLLHTSATGGDGGVFVECEASLASGRLVMAASLRSTLEKATKTFGGLPYEIQTRSRASSYRDGWVLYAQIVDTTKTKRGTVVFE